MGQLVLANLTPFSPLKPKLLHEDGTPVVFANPSALLLPNGTASHEP